MATRGLRVSRTFNSSIIVDSGLNNNRNKGLIMKARKRNSRSSSCLGFQPFLLLVQCLVVTLFCCNVTTTLSAAEETPEDASACRLEVWAFDSIDRCEAMEQPNVIGYLIPDGKCRTVEVAGYANSNENSVSDDYSLLPGTYSAECTEDGKISFIQSGCAYSDCRQLSYVGDQDNQENVCERDFELEAALYSRLQPPEFQIQDPDSVTTEGFYSCSRLVGANISVTFTVFGDCCSSSKNNTEELGNSNGDNNTNDLERYDPTPSTPSSLRKPSPAPSASEPVGGPEPASEPEPTTDGTEPVEEFDQPEEGEVKQEGEEEEIPEPGVAKTGETADQVQITIASSSDESDMGTIIGAAIGSVILLLVCGFLLYRRGKHVALTQTKKIAESKAAEVEGHKAGATDSTPHIRWRNEIIVDPTHDDVSTLGGSMINGMNMFENGVIDVDERTASVNVDYDYTKNRYKSGAHNNEDITLDDVGTSNTNSTPHSIFGMLGAAHDFLIANDDMSFERQYESSSEDEDTDNAVVQRKSISKDTGDGDDGVNSIFRGIATRSKTTNPALNNSSTSIAMVSKPFVVKVPLGSLGLGFDTPRKGVPPTVYSIKKKSLLAGRVEKGDRLLSIDSVDVTDMCIAEVLKELSRKTHLCRTLVFVRPIPEK